MGMKKAAGARGLAALGVALLITFGCAQTHQGRKAEMSGFLGDYSQLREGEGDEALLVYINPKANARDYTKILMEPIKVYPGVGDTPLRKISDEDLQKLVNYFDAAIRAQLNGQYAFVTAPGPGVMRFRIALTEAKSANVPRDVVSTIIPIGMAVSALKTVATGRGTGIGETSMEFEAQDSLTGERLGAAVDKRVGNKLTGEFDKFNRWRATQAAFDYWAERLHKRLSEMQSPQPSPVN